MSSGDRSTEPSEGEGNDPTRGPVTKQSANAMTLRQLNRACDGCRKKKRKCDASPLSDAPCSHCVANHWTCTFEADSKRKTPPKGYIEDLEARCEKLEEIISRVAPYVDLEIEVGPKFDRETWASVKENLKARLSVGKNGPKTLLPTSAFPGRTNTTSQIHLSVFDSNPKSTGKDIPGNVAPAQAKDLDALVEDLEYGMKKMAIQPADYRYHGKPSGWNVCQMIAGLKEKVEGVTLPDQHVPGVPPELSKLRLRPWYWRACPWEYLTYHLPSPSELKFPSETLGRNLIDLCFTKAFVIYPILHRPTFERDVNVGRHLKDLNFAKLYLLACALGSKYSTDSRVALKAPTMPGEAPELQWGSAGWMFFAQVMAINRPILQSASLMDLQAAALTSLYFEGRSSPYAAEWLVVGVALRSVQDIGAHQEGFYIPERQFENQMWRRVFWFVRPQGGNAFTCSLALDDIRTLVVMERICNTALGRGDAILLEHIDVALPLEVDDEYFNEVTCRWEQPVGKISRLSVFNQVIKLSHILPRASQITQSLAVRWAADPLFSNPGLASDYHEITQLDSAITTWFNELPDSVAWDPSDPDEFHLEQTACLRIMYHQAQTIVHQRFVPLIWGWPSTPNQISPSFAICKFACRSTARILDSLDRRGKLMQPQNCSVAFATGLMSMVTIWDAKTSGSKQDLSGHIADIKICIRALQGIEDRFHIAGAFADVVTQLASAEIPRSTDGSNGTSIGRKRTRADSTGPQQRQAPHLRPTEPGDNFGAIPPWLPPTAPFGFNPAFDVGTPGPLPELPHPAAPSASAVPPPVVQPSSSNWHHYHRGGLDLSAFDTEFPGFVGFDSDVFANPFTTLDPPAPTLNNQDWSWLQDVGLFAPESTSESSGMPSV